jgi:pimeloyl-ACP methyl ester carboxylesterase
MNSLLLCLAAAAGLVGLGLLLLAAAVWFSGSQVLARRTPDPPANPAELGLAHEPVVFASRDGLELGGWFVPGADPVRGTVVFCHGQAGSLDGDLKQVPILHQHGYDVLQFDFRAHGRSESQVVSISYYERLDLLGAVDYLHERGIGRFGVLGFSMGGSVAMSTAAGCPAIAAVVSDGGFARLGPTLQAGLRERGLPAWLARALASLTLRSLGWRLGCDLTTADPLRWVDQISPRPLLLIHGERDPYVSLGEMEALFESAGNPKALWIVPGAGHRQADQTCPDNYWARVLGFFDRWLAEEGNHGHMAGH